MHTGSFEVNDEMLALDAIDRVGPGGHYLMDEHTLHHMRTEHFYPPTVFDRQERELWEQDGSVDAWYRAKEIARRILIEHKPKPLDPIAEEEIRGSFTSLLVL